MVYAGFKVSGSSLALMRPGERGVVTRLNGTNTAVNRSLEQMGLMPGMTIMLEQRSPRFIVKSGGSRFTLDDQMIRSIYVRLAN